MWTRQLCKEVVYQLMRDSSIEFWNVDYRIAAKTTVVCHDRGRETCRNIDHLMSRRTTNDGRPPKLSGFFNEKEGAWSHVDVATISHCEQRRVLASTLKCHRWQLDVWVW